MPRGQESRLLCTAKVRPHSRRATGLSPFRGQPDGPRACSQGGRSEWQGTLRSVQGQPPSFQLPAPLRPATAAALDRAALRNGQVPTPAAPHHTLSAPPPSPSRSQETFQHCRLDSGARSPSLLLVVSAPTSAAPPGPRALTNSLCRHLPRNTSACDPPGACSHGQADRCSACPQTGETCLPSSEAEFLMGNSPCSPTGCKSTFLGPHGNFAACLLYPVV